MAERRTVMSPEQEKYFNRLEKMTLPELLNEARKYFHGTAKSDGRDNKSECSGMKQRQNEERCAILVRTNTCSGCSFYTTKKLPLTFSSRRRNAAH